MNQAKKKSKVLIKRKDLTIFELKSINENKSYLDVKCIDLDWDKNEIIEILCAVDNR